jgi:hypothetical protein
MDSSKLLPPRAGGPLTDMRTEASPDSRWEAAEAVAASAANHAVIAASRGVLVRTIALLS